MAGARRSSSPAAPRASGFASAREMKARGWRVFATARKPEDIEAPARRSRRREPLSRLRRARLDRRGGRGTCSQRRTARSPRCSTTAPMASRARSRISGPRCCAPSSKRMCSAGTTLPRAHPGDAGARAKGGSCSAPRCSGSSPRPIVAPIAPRNSPSRLSPTRSAWSSRRLASSVVLIEPGPIASRFVEHALEAYRRNIDLEALGASRHLRARIARLEAGRQPDLQARS